MARWADYLVSEVAYGPDRRIARVRQHRDTGEHIGDGELVGREELAANLKRGVSYCTVFSSNANWKRGDAVRLIKAGRGHSIRTDSNRTEYDNLRFLPEIREPRAEA